MTAADILYFPNKPRNNDHTATKLYVPSSTHFFFDTDAMRPVIVILKKSGYISVQDVVVNQTKINH